MLEVLISLPDLSRVIVGIHPGYYGNLISEETTVQFLIPPPKLSIAMLNKKMVV